MISMRIRVRVTLRDRGTARIRGIRLGQVLRCKAVVILMAMGALITVVVCVATGVLLVGEVYAWRCVYS